MWKNIAAKEGYGIHLLIKHLYNNCVITQMQNR